MITDSSTHPLLVGEMAGNHRPKIDQSMMRLTASVRFAPGTESETFDRRAEFEQAVEGLVVYAAELGFSVEYVLGQVRSPEELRGSLSILAGDQTVDGVEEGVVSRAQVA